MEYPLYKISSGVPIYDVPTGRPIYGVAVSIGQFQYKVYSASWTYLVGFDSYYSTFFELPFAIQGLLVSNYGSRSWWDSQWRKAEAPTEPEEGEFPFGAHTISHLGDRVFRLDGFVSGGSLQPGQAYQSCTIPYGSRIETSVGGWILSGNSVTLSGSGYSGGLSAFGPDVSGAIVDSAGIPIATTGTAVDVSSISGGGTFYVLPTNPILSAFSEIDGEDVLNYTKTLVDCSGLTVTAAP